MFDEEEEVLIVTTRRKISIGTNLANKGPTTSNSLSPTNKSYTPTLPTPPTHVVKIYTLDKSTSKTLVVSNSIDYNIFKSSKTLVVSKDFYYML